MRRRALEILKIMAEVVEGRDLDDDFECEIVRDGKATYLGAQRIASATLDELLCHVAIKSVGEEGRGLERYVLNETGRAIAHDPDLAYEVQHALFSGQAFTIRDGCLDFLTED